MSPMFGIQYLGRCIEVCSTDFLFPTLFHRQLLCSLVGHTDNICALSTVQDTMLVITGGKDCEIIVWNAEDGTRMATLNGHIGRVRCLLPFYLEQESGRALQIASGSIDLRAKVSDPSKSTAVKLSSRQIWDVAGNVCSHTLVGHLQLICRLAVDSTSNVLCTGSQDSTIRLWSTLSGWVSREERQPYLV